MEIQRIVSGMPGWNVIFELDNGLMAMCNVSHEEPIHFSTDIRTFLRHGYFEDASKLSTDTIENAMKTLAYYLGNKALLRTCRFVGNRIEILALLGLEEGGCV